jgi:alanine-glyoxylate transaminase/serine-glyoxylate transaminase/serine-pyruvate transaminase
MNQFTKPSERLLLGPGPSNVNPRVIEAMTLPIMGYLDPIFLKIMDEVVDMLKVLFGTSNQLTLPLSGTGTSGMEAALINILEPGDNVVVGINGLFGQRLADISERCGANVTTISVDWGNPLDLSAIEEAVQKIDNLTLLAAVHVETSTGVVQPLEPLSNIAHKYGALFLADAVTSLGGIELKVDDWEVDICYGATQKCVGAPPGMSPITLNEQAVEKIKNRKTKVPSFYLDLLLLEKYWITDRTYHHTASMPMIYGLREALIMALEEGLINRAERHALNAQALKNGLKALGMGVLAKEGYQAPPLTAPVLPTDIDEPAIRKSLLNTYGIEIGGGFGPLAGKIWRIGLMGESSQQANVLTFLQALETLLTTTDYSFEVGSSLTSANLTFKNSQPIA